MQIVSLGYKSFYENFLDSLPCSPDFDKALHFITDAVMNDVVLVKRNVDNPKSIDGVLGMKIHYTWFSSEPTLHTFLFFIKEDKRSFLLAKDFLKAAQEYAIINRLPIVFDLFAQKDVSKKIKLLKYLGFKECGSLLIFNPIKGV